MKLFSRKMLSTGFVVRGGDWYLRRGVFRRLGRDMLSGDTRRLELE